MKVLLVNSVCGVGSTGRIVTDIYNLLKSNGHDCIIAYGRGRKIMFTIHLELVILSIFLIMLHKPEYSTAMDLHLKDQQNH
jgi:hypothetical protein